MISDGLELSMAGGRVCHSWCMGVVIHSYGGLGGGMDGGGGWYACETTPGGAGCVWEMLEHFLRVR